MNVIELAGRLKETVRLNGLDYQCKDVNLDKDFLLEFTKALVKKINNDLSKPKIYYTKAFDEEIISEVKFEIQIDIQQYKIVLTRDTYGDRIIIGCRIEPGNEELELFGTVYNVKIKIIELFNKICENSNIFMLQDFNNELICQTAYLKIHKVENRLRNLITKYLMKKYGRLMLSNSLQKEVDQYSKWFRDETKGKYLTFKRINTDYANLDFSKIIKILDLKDVNCIDEAQTSISSELGTLNDLLSDDINFKEVNKQISKIKGRIAKRKNVFDDSMSETECKEIKDVFGNKNERSDLGTILDNDFRELWGNELSKMRNMIAHNKPVCRELFNDIVSNCDEANKKFDECFDFINQHFYSDEEGVFSALEDMAYEEEERNFFDIEKAREEVGIQFSLSESVIEDELIESSKPIQRFIDTIAVLGDMRAYFEIIESLNEEYRIIDDEDITTEFKLEVFTIINKELCLGKKFNDVSDLDLIDIIYELLYSEVDIDKAISIYTDDNLYPFCDEKFERFSMDYQVNWFSPDNKNYEVNFNGELEPENDGRDLLDFNLIIDNENKRTYTIQINYGDYAEPSEGGIEDNKVDELISDIEHSISNTRINFERIYRIAKELMKSLNKFKAQRENK